METSEVRKRVLGAIERSRRGALERRARADEATREFDGFLERTAVPLFRQVAGALKAQSYAFQVFTPGGSVRLMSERAAEDYIEVVLDTSGPQPIVLGRTSRQRGRRVLEAEQPVGSGAVADLGEEQLLQFLLAALEPFVER
jgi:hypothetical protein